MIIVAAGSAYDITIAFTAKSKAQTVADSVALNAAIFVKNNGHTPASNAEGFVDGQTYNISATGYDMGQYAATADGGGSDSWVTVTYDEENGQATAVITGTTSPKFMSIANITSVRFNTSATVNYAVEDINNSVSIAVVLDVSGSMYYYDETDTKREDAMESAVVDLMHNLADLVLDQEADGRILRTGMIPFYSQIWTPAVVNMKWGTISDNNIYALWEGGGTNSSNAMGLAKTWMSNETPYHEQETGRTNPKKYVILMTDGANNSQSYDTQTLARCTEMKDAGVEIFTIGYALNLQTYGSPKWWRTYTPSQNEINRATNLLSQCATDPEHFKRTSNDTDISTIFDGIGADIAESALRISH
jgi:uncharacterized protein YegL